MFSKKVNLVFRDKDGDSKWFRFLNITMWVQKFCKPSVRGNFGCIKPLLQSRIIGMDVGKYEGEWKDGEMHGTGTLKISRIFGGNMNSYGLVPFPFSWKLIDQGKYEGEWKNGKEHGKGIRFYSAGLMNNDIGKYVGEWKEGEFHRQGTLIYSDGEKYEGEWKYGLEHGNGIRTSSNGGIIFIGKWKNGKYFHGTYYFDNGDKHFGFFKDGVAKGHGIRTYFDGRKHTGEFKCREERSEGTCILTGKNTVSIFIESIPTGFDTNKNYIGCQTVKYKEEKRASFTSYFFHD